MNVLVRTLPLWLAAFAAGCGEEPEKLPISAPPAPKTPPAQPAPKQPPPAPNAGGRTPPATREMPKFPPLTEAKAKSVLLAQLDRIAGDDVSRQALLYLADLGDRAGADAAKKLVEQKAGKWEDLAGASVGAETLLAYGEPGVGATVLKIAQQYRADEEDPDEFLLRALGRVDGAERAAANAELVKIAEERLEDDPEVAKLAVEVLAQNAAPEARELFAKAAADAGGNDLDGHVRGLAAAGLLRLKDPRAAGLAEKLVSHSLAEEPDILSDVLMGLGVPGAVEAVPYVKSAVDRSVASDEATSLFDVPAAVSSLVRIHERDGGVALVPWLKELAQKNDGDHEDDVALALWAFGDDGSAPVVAKTLEGSVAAWNQHSGLEPAVEILDIAARRGVAGKPPLRAAVDSAAQIDPSGGGKAIDYNVVPMNLAAAHAFLKSGGK